MLDQHCNSGKKSNRSEQNLWDPRRNSRIPHVSNKQHVSLRRFQVKSMVHAPHPNQRVVIPRVIQTQLIERIRPTTPKYYKHGPRYPLIILTRMRIHFCALNAPPYQRNTVDSPQCACGAPYENLVHIFLYCPTNPAHGYPQQLDRQRATSC